jgi:uncharacterized protein (TIGR03000 family)
MCEHMLMSRLFWAVGGALLLAAPLQAQPPGQSLGQQPYSSRGPVTYGPVTYYGAQPAYSGYPPRRAGEEDYGFVSYYTSATSPIFFTSINYPGVYGSHTIGVQARAYVSQSRMTYYPPAEGIALRDPIPLGPSQPPPNPVPPVNVASLRVRVPTPDAEVYFQGTRMTKTGTDRDFVTPALLANRDYTYDIRAVWTDKDGREVVRERQLTVRAGDKLDVDLLAAPRAKERPPEEAPAPTLRTIPRPERPRR